MQNDERNEGAPRPRDPDGGQGGAQDAQSEILTEEEVSDISRQSEREPYLVTSGGNSFFSAKYGSVIEYPDEHLSEFPPEGLRLAVRIDPEDIISLDPLTVTLTGEGSGEWIKDLGTCSRHPVRDLD